jgi:hypothetical protein
LKVERCPEALITEEYKKKNKFLDESAALYSNVKSLTALEYLKENKRYFRVGLNNIKSYVDFENRP